MASPAPVQIVSTPNPSVLPLLLAMSRDPHLPVRLIPVKSGSGISQAFASSRADGVLSMTWVAAGMAATGVAPDLALVSVTFWRGFFELTPSGVHASRLSDLQGKNLLLSGPVGGGRDAGPDILFKATMKRDGFDPTRYSDRRVRIEVDGKTISVTRRVYTSGDFRVYYMPVMDATQILIRQIPLNNGGGNSGTKQPASGAFMVEPAATGIVLNGYLRFTRLTKAIDVQKIFTGYTEWPAGELPLGGLSLRTAVLDDPSRSAEVAQLRIAYEKSASDLMAARGHPLRLARYARAISKGIDIYYRQYGLSLPAPVIMAAIHNGGREQFT
ncbi:MAG: hypothetical protein ACYDHM_08570 [Acidiferrobacterales bacterium]